MVRINLYAHVELYFLMRFPLFCCVLFVCLLFIIIILYHFVFGHKNYKVHVYTISFFKPDITFQLDNLKKTTTSTTTAE
jgi:hypothetical protein